MNTEIISDTLKKSLAGTFAFPDVVRTLIGEGVESYRADLVRREETFYMPDGATFVEKMDFASTPIAENFSAPDLIAAIRDSQAGRCKYREFLNRAVRAGVTSYVTYLSGKKVIYFGRKGEFHVEEFPKAKS
ncbi:MAG: DUF1398 family protein [Terriglobales bacterium]